MPRGPRTGTSTAAWRPPGLVLVLSPVGAVLVLEGNATGPEYDDDDEYGNDRVAFAGATPSGRGGMSPRQRVSPTGSARTPQGWAG